MACGVDPVERRCNDHNQCSNDPNCNRGTGLQVLDNRQSLTVYYTNTETKEKHMSWNVYRQGRWIDRVWFTQSCDADYVRNSLIDHDGLPSDIVVKRG